MTVSTSEDTTHSTVADQHAWLQIGAKEKARSIFLLTEGLNISTVLEIGAGTGAVLEQLNHNEFADEYFALESSKELYFHLQNAKHIDRLSAVDNSVLGKGSLSDRHYDLAVLSHVIEHVPDPARLLLEAMDVAKFVVVEVPLDATWLGNVRTRVKVLIHQRPRTNNPAGHIQFFSVTNLRQLISWCGGSILNSRLYTPEAQMRFARNNGSLIRRAFANLVWAGYKMLGEDLWARHYYGHYAVLMTKKNSPGPEQGPDHPLYFDNIQRA